MRINIMPFCLLQGDKFSPAEAERKTNLTLSEKHEIGELVKLGKNKGKPYAYGSAILDPPSDYDKTKYKWSEDWLIDKLINHIQTFRECGADEITLKFLISYSIQCNMEFHPEQLRKISSLNIPFFISCYQADENELFPNDETPEVENSKD
jgi:hypothetical protein